jgi:hypothetical protein
VIKVAYTVIPLMSIPVIFMVAKQALLDIFYTQVPNQEIPSKLYYKLTLLLFVVISVLAILLDDVGLAYAFIGSCSTMLAT